MSRFRTLEISDPAFESQNLRQITVHGPALKGRGDITVFVPPGNHKDLPLALLLHGVYGSHWAWTGSGGAHRTALELIQSGGMRPMILAMPSDGLWADGSGYLRHAVADYEAWIMQDVVDAVRQAIPQAGSKAPLMITGLSMGGYGALRLGAKYPRSFAAISAHSSVTQPSEMEGFVERMPEAAGERVLDLMLQNRAQLPPLRFDCGSEDILIEPNRRLHQALKDAGIAHTYDEFSGGHSWQYWREHIKDSLLFFEKSLK